LKNYFSKFICISIFIFSTASCNKPKTISVSLNTDIVNPKTYVVYKVANTIVIDGKADEQDWEQAKYTSDFIDIEGVKIPKQQTNVKMLP